MSIDEIMREAYESYIHPGSRDEAYVMLLLAVGTAKTREPKLNTFANFEKEAEDKLVDAGVKVIEGKKSPEDYVKDVEKALSKAVDVKIEFDAYTADQIRLRAERSVRNKDLQKDTDKKIKQDGTLKEDWEVVNDLKLDAIKDNFKPPVEESVDLNNLKVGLSVVYDKPNFYRANIEINNNIVGQVSLQHSTRNLDLNKAGRQKTTSYYQVSWDRDVVRNMFRVSATNASVPQEGFLNGFRKRTPVTAQTIESYLKRELPTLQAQENTEKSIEESVLEEALIDDVKAIVQKKGKATMLDILQELGVQPSTPPNNQQVAIFVKLKSLLAKGEVTREKVGKSFVYSIGSGTPQVQVSKPVAQQKTSSPKPASTSQLSKLDKLKDKINDALLKRGYKQGQVSVQNNQNEHYIYILLPKYNRLGELDSWNGGQIRYYYGGLNKGKVTAKQHGGPEVGFTTEILKAMLPPKRSKGDLNKAAKREAIPGLANNLWPYEGRWEMHGNYLSLSTNDRGPRTDHGGGDDGDGWMSPSQIARIAAPYKKKWEPRLKEFVKKLKANKIKVKDYYVDYGEKGHIGLDITLDL